MMPFPLLSRPATKISKAPFPLKSAKEKASLEDCSCAEDFNPPPMSYEISSVLLFHQGIDR